jgi:predicted SPOUT superfamily RNA methylase MTH1
MQKREHKLTLAVPVSVVSDIPHLREKTLEIGLIGRAAAIFRVNEIVIFTDNPGAHNQSRDRATIATLLTYMETPQYLRKRLFKLLPELRYAGILPPLRTPHHPLESRGKKLKVGEHREGLVISVKEKGSIVDIGIENPVVLADKKLALNSRVAVKVTKKGNPPEIVMLDKRKIKEYWGFTVTPSRGSFGKLVKTGGYDLVVATSKMGKPVMQVWDDLSASYRKARNILVGFGAPSSGLQKIVAKDKLSLDKIAHFTVNTIPDQGTATVRTEEAIYSTLALLNTIQK